MERVQSIVPRVLRQRGLEGHAVAAQVTVQARLWLEEKVVSCRGQVRVECFKDACLVLAADHPIVLQELASHTPNLLTHLKSIFPGITIREVKALRG